MLPFYTPESIRFMIFSGGVKREHDLQLVNKFSKKPFKVVPVKFQLLPKIVLFEILFPKWNQSNKNTISAQLEKRKSIWNKIRNNKNIKKLSDFYKTKKDMIVHFWFSR